MGCRDQLNHSLKLLWGVFFELQAMALLFFGDDVGGVADEKFLVHVPDLFLGFFSFAIEWGAYVTSLFHFLLGPFTVRRERGFPSSRKWDKEQ